MRRYLAAVFIVALALLNRTHLKAQGYLTQTGAPALSTQMPVENGFINVNNGNLHIEIPLAGNTQRGSLALGEKLVYDSRIWQIIDIDGQYSWSPTNVPNSVGGWRFSSGDNGAGTYRYNVGQGTVNCGPAFQVTYNVAWNFIWTDSTGTAHSFASTETQGYNESSFRPKCSSDPVTHINSSAGYATDGSGYYAVVSNYTALTVYDPQGNQYTPKYYGSSSTPSTQLVDPNGNYWSNDASGNLVDTVNRTPVQVSTNGNLTYYDVLGAGGTRQRYIVTMGTVQTNTSFQQSAVGEDIDFQFNVIKDIELPDHSHYSFGYDSSQKVGGSYYTTAYGELTSITLPSGGTIGYGYTNFSDSFQNQNRWISSRTKDGGTTTFVPTVNTLCSSSSGCSEKVTVTSPAVTAGPGQPKTGGNDTVYTFHLDAGSISNASSWITGIDVYQGSASTGAKIKSASYQNSYSSGQYNSGGTSTSGVTYQTLVSTTATSSLSDVGLTSQVVKTFAPDYVSPTSVKEWDYFPASTSIPASPTRETDYTYASAETRLLPIKIATVDGGGNVVSQTNYGYDETTGTGHAALAPVSNLPQQPLVPTQPRGNLTTVSQLVAAGGTSLSTQASYDAAGVMVSMTDPNGTTTFKHDSSDTFVTTATPPTPSSGVSLPSSSQFDFNTGLLSSQTDSNGNSQSYTNYDWAGRVTEIDGLDANGTMMSKKTFSYTATSQSAYVYQGATVFEDTETQYDSYGRPSRIATATGQSANPWDQQDICYNEAGKVSFRSYIYQGAGWSTAKVCSGAGDTYTYDALSRVSKVAHGDGNSVIYIYTGRAMQKIDENGVTTITQVDGLGRTTAVCEISSNKGMPNSGAPASCGLDIPGTGFLTTYAYDMANHKTTTTQGAQSRIFQTDALGRTTLVSEPESGTTTYSYAYNTTGLVVTRTKPLANQTNPAKTVTTTTQYDAVGRVVSVSYADGLTSTKTFAYDMAMGWGNANLGASKGHLTYASTGNAATGTQFAYDALGRVTATVQCLPTRCGNAAFDVHRSYGYDWAGDMTSDSYFTQGGTGTQVTTTYGVDVAGAVTSISNTLTGAANDGGAVISNLQNGPFGPISYSYGNGLGSAISYDTLGRLSGLWLCNGSTLPNCANGTQQYGFSASWRGSQVQSTSDSVLNSQAMFGYDEFNRLSTASYPNRSQAFSFVYDRYGNRWQQNVTLGSGSSPQLSFNAANNQISGYSYDAAGNLISDGMHSYTYDAEGNLIRVDNCATAGYAYDAFNHRVQAVANGVDNLYAYNLAGQRASIWDGASAAPQLISATTYWNGSPIAYFDGYTTTFQHQDGEGTERLRTGVDGSMLGAYQTLAFGDQAGAAGSDGDAAHYAGLDFDPESWTGHAQYRQYNQTQGRWMQPDPYSGSYDMGNPQSLNRYAYVMNNPMSMTDPTGQDGGEGGGGVYGTAGCIAAAGEGGVNPIADLSCGINILTDILGLFGGPQFNGTLQPRPASGIWDEHSPVKVHADIAGALGLPDGGCEFGSCGGGTDLTQGSNASGTNPYPDIISDAAWAWALTGLHYQVHGIFWTYGHWCGQDGSGNPTGRLDAACLQHDFCYYSSGNLGAGDNVKPWVSNPALLGCNQPLCATALAIANANNHRGGNLNEGTAALEAASYFAGFGNIVRGKNRCR